MFAVHMTHDLRGNHRGTTQRYNHVFGLKELASSHLMNDAQVGSASKLRFNACCFSVRK